MLTASSLALATVCCARFYQAEPAPVVGTTEHPVPLCLTLVLPSSGRRSRLLRRHYSPVIAPTSTCANPVWLSSASVLHLVRGILQVATSPCCHQDLLDVILRVFPWLLGPLPRRSHRVHVPVNFPDVIGLPLGRLGRLPALVHECNFSWERFRGCRHSAMFRPPSLFASQVAPTATAMP